METSSAYLLVFHGSRDPRPQIAVTRLAELVRQQLTARKQTLSSQKQAESILVETASLEFSEIPLHQQIERFARQAREQGLATLQIIPLFLLCGVHVTEDIPTELSLVRSNISLELKPYLGGYRGMNTLLLRQFADFPAERRILFSHGSRRQGGNQIIETIAHQVKAVAAYWSVEPSLQTQVEVLLELGIGPIAILPYFLFTSSITDAIELQFSLIAQKQKNVKLFLGQPLGATPELARVIVEEGIE